MNTLVPCEAMTRAASEAFDTTGFTTKVGYTGVTITTIGMNVPRTYWIFVCETPDLALYYIGVDESGSFTITGDSLDDMRAQLTT
jgi:hypothetical protein